MSASRPAATSSTANDSAANASTADRSPSVPFADALDVVVRRELAGCQGVAAIERLSGGASMETYRVTLTARGSCPSVVCLRRGAGGVERPDTYAVGLDVEAKLITVAKAAGVPEPTVLYVLTPDDGVGVGFLMEWLDGETLGARIVRAAELDEVRSTLARQCGEHLARIHAIDLDVTGLRHTLRTVSPTQYVEETWARYRDFPTPQPMIDYAARWLTEHAPNDVDVTLVHNDFRNGNLMVSPTLGINAVLDWETAHIGDPMRDLGWLCTNSWRFGRRDLPVGGFGERADLFAGYEAVTGEAVDEHRVHYWEVFGSFWWAIGCLGMADHYRTGPDATVERPAIGRRSSECQLDCVLLLIDGPVELLPGANGAPVAGPQHDAPVARSAQSATAVGDMPRLDELLISVRDFLHADVMNATEGRLNFMSRVAGNSLDIVLRELALRPALLRSELTMLRDLLGGAPQTPPSSDEQLATVVTALRAQLVAVLRDGSMPLDEAGLASYLRHSVVHQVAIDQPRYSAFRHVIERDDPVS